MEYTLSVLNDPARIPELIELFRTGLGETTEAYWKWRLFTDNGQPDRPIAIVAEDETGKLCGMSSVLPVVYGTGASERKCLQFCDWVVRPAHRGKGIINLIYQYALDRYRSKGYDFIMEFPNDNSCPIFQKYGFHEEPQINCWNSIVHLKFPYKRLHDFWIGDTEVRFSADCPLGEKAFGRDGRQYRSSAYLRWKYDLNPATVYHWVSMWERGICIGYIVYTITKGRLRTAVNVYDWEYPSADSTLLNEIFHRIGKQGNYISVWGRYSQEQRKLLENCGLRKKEGGTRLMIKAISGKGVPFPLTLTRIDTDY